jgi:glycogen operon protein
VTEPGSTAHPLGATLLDGGANFSVYSRDAARLELLLFDAVDDARPARVIALDPARHRTYHYWHVFVPGLAAGQLYAYRAQGPADPTGRLRFDPGKVLLDPYGRGVAVPARYDRMAGAAPGDNAAVAMRSVVTDPRAYDWEGDEPLRSTFSRTVIYEMHVAGFTRHPSSGVAPHRRGTYAGLVEKIPYLEDLGVTAVELLPVFQFDPFDAPPGRVNYWGYAPVSFFAPHAAYSSRTDPLGPVDEFRDMVKALHRAGIEVILDVVFNHTAEGDERGPTLCLRGLQNDAYYILEGDGPRYANYTGTGNTLNANHPVVRRLIVDSLRYWVEVMHVDGFRFDLASILSRDEAGRPLANPPVLFDIETDPVLAGVKLIAEAWDAAGLYQVGSFVGDFWKEWNGRFRDDVRSFVRGEAGTVSRLASRLLASPDIFGHEEREPEQSVNFVTCHDGFTLNDLVCYDRKHNEANGEGNRDGADDNRSWNCGLEGPTDDAEIERLRSRQIRNLLALNLLALGTPMLLMGDEIRRTQLGNNNAYCQDGPISWLDWTLAEQHRDLHRFVKRLIALRLGRDLAAGEHSLTLSQLLTQARIEWHGIHLGQPDWGEASRSLACTVWSMSGQSVIHLMASAYWEPLSFELPRAPGDGWLRLVDTARDAPDDVAEPGNAALVSQDHYPVQPRSVVLLLGRTARQRPAGASPAGRSTAEPA